MGPGDGRARGGGTGVGVLLTEMPGSTDRELIEKQLGPDTTLETSTVGDAAAYWIAGGQHELQYLDPRRPSAAGHDAPGGQHPAVGGTMASPSASSRGSGRRDDAAVEPGLLATAEPSQ